jgi:hypothetical protein
LEESYLKESISSANNKTAEWQSEQYDSPDYINPTVSQKRIPKIIVFSQYISYLDQIIIDLKAAGVIYHNAILILIFM